MESQSQQLDHNRVLNRAQETRVTKKLYIEFFQVFQTVK